MKIVLKILKISIIVFVIGCISFFIYLFGGQILGISEILSVHKSILKTPHININDLTPRNIATIPAIKNKRVTNILDNLNAINILNVKGSS